MSLTDRMFSPGELTGPKKGSWATGLSTALTVITTIVVVGLVMDGAWAWAVAVFLGSVVVEVLVLAVVSRRRRSRQPPAGVGG